MKKHYRNENDCLNCGTELQGKFCHNCGQENLQLKESFGHIINHLISDYFHFDHQFFGTLKPLLFKPGFLTNEYMAGRRVQYLHPVKMYIFISFIYFLLVFQFGGHNSIIKIDEKPTASLVTDTSAKAKTLNKVTPPSPKRHIENAYSDTTYEQYLTTQKKLPADKRDGFWSGLVSKKAFSYKEKYGKRAGSVFEEEVEHNVPKMMFVALPLFALILKVTFSKSHKFYIEHLMYSIHFHCFVFLLISFILLVDAVIPPGWTSLISLLSLAGFVIGIRYFYKSLLVVYHRGALRTITKLIGMALVYWAVTVICMAGVVVITGFISG